MTTKLTAHERAMLQTVNAASAAYDEAQQAYWYRRKTDKSGYEVLFTLPEDYELAGIGESIAECRNAEDAEQYTHDMQTAFIAKRTVQAYLTSLLESAEMVEAVEDAIENTSIRHYDGGRCIDSDKAALAALATVKKMAGI